MIRNIFRIEHTIIDSYKIFVFNRCVLCSSPLIINPKNFKAYRLWGLASFLFFKTSSKITSDAKLYNPNDLNQTTFKLQLDK